MQLVDPIDSQPSLLFRLIVRLGRRWGLRWISRQKLALISEMERSHSLKGPGFFWIQPLTQRVKMIVSIAPDHATITSSNILTKDGLPCDITTALEFCFDPRTLPSPASIGVARRMPQPTDRYLLLETHTQRAFQEVAAKYYAEQLYRGGKLFKSVEEDFLRILQSRLEQFAIQLLPGCILKDVKLPNELRDRLVRSVDRQVSADDSNQHSKTAWSLLMQSEVVETLAKSPHVKPRIDVNSLTNIAKDNLEQPTKLINSSGRPMIEQPGEQANSDQTSIVTNANSATAETKNKRRRSRLI